MSTKKKKETVKATFDPNKNYDWTELANEPMITLTGAEFGFIRQVINNYINKPEVQEALNFVTAANLVQEKLVKAVEEGKITEVIEAVQEEG